MESTLYVNEKFLCKEVLRTTNVILLEKRSLAQDTRKHLCFVEQAWWKVK